LKKINTYILLAIVLNISTIIASDNRLKAMGNMTWSVPDLYSQVNLYQFAGNNAQLKNNDSTNWMLYKTESFNNWGNLKRTWDAYKNQFHVVSFSGVKHLDENKIFYGDIKYNWDYRNDVDYSIEKNPYGYDPFVLADYTTGSILYRGPEVFVAFNHLVTKTLFWGLSINYNINRGLKENPSEAEIISRNIKASLDLIYKFSDNYKFGLSFSPYQMQDITKLVSLKSGLEPTIRKYRGEFEYRERVGTKDRTSDYDGYEIKPQFSYNSENINHITCISYFYQWHRIYDGTLKRYFDGYFQAQHYGLNSITRLKMSDKYQSHIFVAFNYEEYNDWAKEPTQNLLMNQDKDINYQISIGGSTILPGYFSTLAAIELHYNNKKPHQIDYLSILEREAANINWLLKLGIEHEIDMNMHFRYGLNFEKYFEDKIWNYYKSYYGAMFSSGFGWRFDEFELDILGQLRHKIETQMHYNQRTYFNFSLQLKQYLN
jgi:uncharacterized protein DUF6850